MLMGRDVGFEDLKDVHPDVYSSLKKLLAYQGDFSELGLVFQVCCASLCKWHLKTGSFPNFSDSKLLRL